ncbi:MAG TPA: hypothetical protein VFQ61_19050 [Polyangiaceae bacterium]|nr:hypothetical protein [Polyangiaceae bacterium]
MADPLRPLEVRLLEEGADDFEAQLLSAGRRDAPRAESRRHILAGLGVIAVASTITTAANAMARPSTAVAVEKPGILARLAGTGKGALAKWGVVSGAGALAVWAGARLSHSEMPAQPSPRAAQSQPVGSAVTAVADPPQAAPAADSVEGTVEGTAEADNAASPSTVAGREATVRGNSAQSGTLSPGAQVPTAGNLTAELALLESSRRALVAGEPKRSLSLLDEYTRKFPRPRLSSEAQVLRIEALVASGERGKALELGRSFLARQGHSPFARRVRSLIGVEK